MSCSRDKEELGPPCREIRSEKRLIPRDVGRPVIRSEKVGVSACVEGAKLSSQDSGWRDTMTKRLAPPKTSDRKLLSSFCCRLFVRPSGNFQASK